MGDESGDAFSEDSLTEKLSKLNSSQQTLSRWCISHRKRAKQVVETWQTVFKSVPQERRVSLLYLANDIMQISRRKGGEFVNEFWKVLPTALKGVYDSGEENCRNVAFRLVNIWAERKVFGSKGQSLLDELLGKKPSPVNVGKNSNPIKVLKRDANSLRIKLAVGGVPEKILTAFQLALDEIANEEAALYECRSAVSCLRDLENDVNVSSTGNLLSSDAVSDIQKQEDTLHQSISQLEKIESTRVALISQLREALQDQVHGGSNVVKCKMFYVRHVKEKPPKCCRQSSKLAESKLEVIQSELLGETMDLKDLKLIDLSFGQHSARGQIEQSVNTKLRLTSISSTPAESGFSPSQGTYNPTPAPPAHSLTSFANPTTSEEENKRATAAAVAAKLAASTSSAQMLSAVLSSLVAEEAALMSKRPKLDEPVISNDANNQELASSAHFQPVTSMQPVQSSAQSMAQLQAPFLPPPPLMASANMPYGYGPSNSAPSNYSMPPFAMPGPPPQQSQPQPQVPPANGGGYYGPVGVGFYGQGHQLPAPPVNRQ
ncbi:regulation of nuclear pre-mRNA domain-containing protein 1b [Phtheirospermum japonicum]|uniref:Regulation of nuclear pre-mRNA domain-containing protein 1b n=1 Tax=Phtheirospermum japonicum TaxID=374723 RepID=A0A830BBE1_9LAMI|nr:regulation of nuclear pre-mRNA domain-containing protein 1b [Phtheirospermum japonicum]